MVTPEQFSKDNPPWRIIGTETEFETTGRRLKEAEIQQAISSLGKTTDPRPINDLCFFTNGAKIAPDLRGLVIEYSTPECLGAAEAAFYEAGGHDYMFDLSQELSRQLGQRIMAVNATAYYNQERGIMDSEDELPVETTGYHENYLTPASTDWGDLAWLRSLLSVRNVICGSGLILPDGQYHCGGKAYDIGQLAGIDRTGGKYGRNKPMIYRLDETEALAAKDEWRRIEVRCGDANMLPWATFMKLALGSVALRQAEYKAVSEELIITDQLATLHQVSSSPDGRVLVETRGKGKMYTHEWLAEFSAAGRELHERVGLPAEEVAALDELDVAADVIDRDPDLLKDRVDYVAKRRILEDTEARGENEYKRLGLQGLWANLDPKIGLAKRAQAKGAFRPAPFQNEYNTDDTVPPQNTRAKTRVEALQTTIPRIGKEKEVDWGLVYGDSLPSPY